MKSPSEKFTFVHWIIQQSCSRSFLHCPTIYSQSESEVAPEILKFHQLIMEKNLSVHFLVKLNILPWSFKSSKETQTRQKIFICLYWNDRIVLGSNKQRAQRIVADICLRMNLTVKEPTPVSSAIQSPSWLQTRRTAPGHPHTVTKPLSSPWLLWEVRPHIAQEN